MVCPGNRLVAGQAGRVPVSPACPGAGCGAAVARLASGCGESVAEGSSLVADDSQSTNLLQDHPLNELLLGTIDELEAVATAGPDSPSFGIPTGLSILDHALGGLRPGLLHLLTGVAGVGTSLLALGMARSASIKHGLTTLLLSGQSPRNEVVNRVVSAEARIPLRLMRNGCMRDEDWGRLTRCISVIAEAPLYISDRPDVTVEHISTTCDRLIREEDLRLVVMDGANLYAQPTSPEHLWAAQARLSADLKRLAIATGIAVVVTTPVNRAPSYRTDRRPMLSDIASSSAYAADADVVIGVHREDLHSMESPRAGEVDLIILKNRYGPNITTTAVYQGHYSRLLDMLGTTSPPPARTGPDPESA